MRVIRELRGKRGGFRKQNDEDDEVKKTRKRKWRLITSLRRELRGSQQVY